MKSLAELAAIKERMKDKISLRKGEDNVRVVVGMATCGISAGARAVLNACVEGVAENGLSDSVTVTQTGCIGMCACEPIVEIFEGNEVKTTYVKVDAEKAKKIISEHLKGGNVVKEYTAENK